MLGFVIALLEVPSFREPCPWIQRTVLEGLESIHTLLPISKEFARPQPSMICSRDVGRLNTRVPKSRSLFIIF